MAARLDKCSTVASITTLLGLTLLAAPAIADYARWCPNRSRKAQVDCSQDTSAPVIKVYAADKAGSFYSDEFTIRGTISSPCLKSAGIYAADREVYNLSTSRQSQKEDQEFEVTIDASEEPEIRAISRSGRTQILKIDVLDIRG